MELQPHFHCPYQQVVYTLVNTKSKAVYFKV